MVRTDSGKPKWWLQDHDSAIVVETPPTINVWYEVFHAQDVRLLWCVIRQDNTATDDETIEIMWTIDGNVYVEEVVLTHGQTIFVWRNHIPAGATAGLSTGSDWGNEMAGYNTGKRGLDFKVEIRQTSVVGAGANLRAWAVYETLEVT